MDTAGEGGSKKGRVRQDGGKTPVKKRKTRTPKVSNLIQELQETVFPDPETQATRKEVLQQTKSYILQLESTLDSLLKMKGDALVENGSPCSLEDIKKEYIQHVHSDQGSKSSDPLWEGEVDPVLLYMTHESRKDREVSVEELKLENSTEPLSSPDVIEFERYFHFYKQTADMLLENMVVSPPQVTHPVVSNAISALWQELCRTGKVSAFQQGLSQAKDKTSVTSSTDIGCTNGGKRNSGAESQEAASSFMSSTPEDILIDDAFELAEGFLDGGANQTLSDLGSPLHESSAWESPEDEKLLHQHVSEFFRAKLFSYTEAADHQCDYEAGLLRCTETFDDEDDL
ncbi:stimulated by retinoic acid gene 8 protein homolog [Leptodactylus fuscus]|uniref:stimulated by retinoic acid gene 8 protein homolog n=1 Tax=Leptodactylus fuscus TaxID=238119 RepID=UPI003F4E9354